MSNLPAPQPVRTREWRGVDLLAPDACFTCCGTCVVKRGDRGIYPITTATDCMDRPVMSVERCPRCEGTGTRRIDDIDREMWRRLGQPLESCP